MNNNFPSGNKESVSLRNSEVWEMRYLRVALGEYKFTVPGIGVGIFHRCRPQGTSKVGLPEPYCPETVYDSLQVYDYGQVLPFLQMTKG